MRTISYEEFTIDVRTARYHGWNAYVRDPCGEFLSAFSRDHEGEVIEAAKDFVDYAIQEELGVQTSLIVAGDTDGFDLSEDDATVWTNVAAQPIYLPAPALTELFVFAADAAPVNIQIQIFGLRGPGAGKPFESVTVSRNLDAVDAQVPVSLADNPGSPSQEDILLVNRMGVVGPAIGEVFITGPGSSGGTPNGNVFGHISPTAPRASGNSGVAAVPHSFEAFLSSIDGGVFEDAVIWVDALFPGSLDTTDGIRTPVKSVISHRFDPPLGLNNPGEDPVGFPAGTTLRLMAHSRRGVGGGPTRVGGFSRFKLRKVPT